MIGRPVNILLAEFKKINMHFLTDIIPLFGPAEQIAGRIKQDIRQATGLTASVGVAPNKFLAKLASETEAEVWAGELEPVSHPGAKTFKENAHFHLGDLAIKTLFTWGHSPGMTTFYVTGLSWPLAIVGDSIFSCSMGGSPTNFEDQYRNNKEKLLTLPKDTVLACGHGPLTTLAQEKQHNPYYAR
jgi:glyoxylase-like metal-dependent hydrolase (beta-lactamase superfamily II)